MMMEHLIKITQEVFRNDVDVDVDVPNSALVREIQQKVMAEYPNFGKTKVLDAVVERLRFDFGYLSPENEQADDAIMVRFKANKATKRILDGD